MLSKALQVVKSKATNAILVILGVLVVGGGGTAVAMAASGGQVPVLSSLVGNSSHVAANTPSAGESASSHVSHASHASHAHTVSLEGVLKSYDTGAGTISVLGNGATSATTIAVDSRTSVNGVHASTLADLSKAIGQKVQVQATKQTGGTLLAWKITVAAATGSQGTGQRTGQGTASKRPVGDQ